MKNRRETKKEVGTHQLLVSRAWPIAITGTVAPCSIAEFIISPVNKRLGYIMKRVIQAAEEFCTYYSGKGIYPGLLAVL